MKDDQGNLVRRIGRRSTAEGTVRAYYVTVAWQDLVLFPQQREFLVTKHFYEHPEQITLLLDPEDPLFAATHAWGSITHIAHPVFGPLIAGVATLLVTLLEAAMILGGIWILYTQFTGGF